MFIYSVFDKKVGCYGQPFFALNDAAARRMVSSATLERNSLLRTFPGDYQLEKLGTWDDNKGVLDPSKPSVIASVSDLVVDLGTDDDEEEAPFDIERMNGTAS